VRGTGSTWNQANAYSGGANGVMGGYELLSNQKPIVYSVIEDTLEIEPYGENLVVAIATLEGKNIDDSVILNRDSVEKGMLNINCYMVIVNCCQQKIRFISIVHSPS
jgi:DNA-directed RNA polymerase beta subunit